MKNQRRSGSFGKAVGAIVLAAVVAVGGAVAGWYAHAQDWFGLAEKTEGPSEEDGVSAGGGLLVEPEEENGIHIAAARLTEETAEAEGISLSSVDVPNLDQIYILTATVTPTSATSSVKWSMAFSDPSAEWAVGKAPEDYIALRPLAGQTDATSAKAIAECKEAFGEQIKITCAAEDVYGTCMADYAQRIIGMNVWFDIVSQEADGAAIAQVDLTAGEDIYIPISSNGVTSSSGSANQQAYELKAEPVLSDVYTVAESNAQCQVSFLTSPVAEDDSHQYFYNAKVIDEILEEPTMEVISSKKEVKSLSEDMYVAIRRTLSIQSIPNAFDPYGAWRDGGYSSDVMGEWQGKIGAYYTFDQHMVADLRAEAEYHIFYNNGFLGFQNKIMGEQEYANIFQLGYYNFSYLFNDPYFSEDIPREEVVAALNSLDEDTVLWRVAASVTGTYGSYTRGDSFIMYCTGESEDAIEIPISNEDPGEIVF